MRYRSLGDSGLLVSVAGLGCNNFGSRLDVQQTRAVVDAAIDAGITLFDTADIYGSGGGSEEMLGEVLGARRDQIVLATKFGHQRVDMGYGPAAGAKGGRAYIRRAVEQSLRRLRTDYLDLYQLHTPDPVTPVGETLLQFPTRAVQDFERSYAFLDSTPCDILITPHPDVSNLWQRLARRNSASDALIDATACRALADVSRERLKKRLATEGAPKGS